MALNDRQRRFVEAYVRLGVAAKAYAEVYPDASEATCETNGPRLLRNAQVREAVDARQANIANELGLTPHYVLAGLERVFRQSIEGAPKFVGKDGDIARDENGEVVREWSPSGANKALELIGKAHGMWVDRAQVDTTGQVVYTLDLQGTRLDGENDDGEEG